MISTRFHRSTDNRFLSLDHGVWGINRLGCSSGGILRSLFCHIRGEDDMHLGIKEIYKLNWMEGFDTWSSKEVVSANIEIK
jgi:hypothetical protein